MYSLEYKQVFCKKENFILDQIDFKIEKKFLL